MSIYEAIGSEGVLEQTVKRFSAGSQAGGFSALESQHRARTTLDQGPIGHQRAA